ncbi:MAG: peptide ABC transporter permease [Sulfobacillus benefaciens]|uniref:Peptide ABC transporter permease n=1 Tax=Sulfobacillus benefaciens TaxID=453960 RepID=A0A2T2XKI8_9FIRM|nr:MAG: peptide ABC transporter permease [Sulfobacillus benefaciens]
MRYLVRRGIMLLLTLWSAITLNFLLPRMMPGNPAEVMLAKFKGKGNMGPQAIHAIKVMLGISNESLFKQYLQYWQEIFHWNFGVSYTYFPFSVTHMIDQALPWTLTLIGVTTVLSFVIGTLLGIWAAWTRGSLLDSVVTSVLTFTSSFPYFWFAMIVVFLLAFVTNVFPNSGGYGSQMSPGFNLSFIASAVYHSILPAVTILVSSLGGWQLQMRNNMISALNEDYVVLARAKGLPERVLAISYAARNAILPNMTGFAMSLGFVVSGAILVELVFSYPGMGTLLYNAVSNEDYPLMQGIFLMIVIGVVMANFVADIVNVALDPRIRRGGGDS